MIKTRTNNFGIAHVWKLMKSAFLSHYAGYATWALFASIFILSLLAGLENSSKGQIYMAGETAAADVFAIRTLKVEDPYATQLRRNQNMELQPLLFDLDKKSIRAFREDILHLLTVLSATSKDVESLTKVQENFNKKTQRNFDRDFFILLSRLEVQNYLTSKLLPYTEKILLRGIFVNRDQISPSSATILIRDPELGNESLLIPNRSTLPDMTSLYLSVGQELNKSTLSPPENRALMQLVEELAPYSLVLNKEDTVKRATTVASTVPPVYYYIQRGELIIAQGEVVSREQQLKMQALYKYSASTIDFETSIGLFLIGSVLVFGLFLSPAAERGSQLYPRAQYFIAFLILIFGLFAILYKFGLSLLAMQVSEVWFYAYPVSGAAGLAALVFSARRFVSIGLIISLFTTVALNGNLEIFMFYFLSCMLNTMLLIKSQSRQDVIRSTLILFLGQSILALAAALFSHVVFAELGTLILAVMINSILALFLVFAISPITEMLFGLTTRFRLMELMNLEQPLLQELMMKAPGTYHHSIVVSNLVEAGAKNINANSLLCKVAALYHDIGKIARPEYFIENQKNIPNKHDTIAPAMSALVLISHVKQGIEYAEKYQLGKEITDIISEHHGNRCISYFYNKAIKNHTGEGEPPKEADYSYPNPRPKSKEAAIIMLADAVEASSRTLLDPTPARIQSHVKNIVHGIYEEGQLDESELTFRDLNSLSDSFTRILNGLFHLRIAYPEKPEKKKANTEQAENNAQAPIENEKAVEKEANKAPTEEKEAKKEQAENQNSEENKAEKA